MGKPTLALLLSVFLLPFGRVASAEEHIVPSAVVRPATVQTPVTLIVAPVQTHQTTVVDRYGQTQTATVPESQYFVYDKWGDADVATYHAPTLPYGAFFVSIGNPTAQPLTVQPAQLSLVERGKTHAVVSDEKKLDQRWQAALWGDYVTAVSAHMFVPPVEAAIHTRLQVMTGAITIAPNTAWRGYVVFDVSATKRSEYTAFLRDAQQLSVTLATTNGPVMATFTTSDAHLAATS